MLLTPAKELAIHPLAVFHSYIRKYQVTLENVTGLAKIDQLSTKNALSLLYHNLIPYTWNFLRHVYFTVKHKTRIFVVEISRMKVIQRFSRFSRLATMLCTKNVCY